MTDSTMECRDTPATGDPVARMLRAAGTWLVAWSARRERRHLMAELDRLGARMLADMGIERTDSRWHLKPGSIAAGQLRIARDGVPTFDEEARC